jgi:hypothetical protein
MSKLLNRALARANEDCLRHSERRAETFNGFRLVIYVLLPVCPLTFSVFAVEFSVLLCSVFV